MALLPTIAIVDDDEGVRVGLASLVRSLGYQVRTYASGVAFLAEAELDEPACMIADIQMPLMTGDELQTRLLAEGRNIPMIFMTGYPTDAMQHRVMGAGAVSFLSKPPDGEIIVKELARALRTGSVH